MLILEMVHSFNQLGFELIESVYVTEICCVREGVVGLSSGYDG